MYVWHAHIHVWRVVVRLYAPNAHHPPTFTNLHAYQNAPLPTTSTPTATHASYVPISAAAACRCQCA